MSAAPAIVLASASPRRSQLLREAGLEFEVLPAGVDESVPEGLEPEAAALLLAERKAEAVARRLGARERWVLAADTVVALAMAGGPVLLGKPAGPFEARAMLARLSGTTHRVATGVCVVRAGSKAYRSAVEVTYVTMRALSADEIEAYVASEEWRGKAGGYAIQESADAFVTGLRGGGFDNVVGLPVALSLRLLREAGAPGAPRMLDGGGERR